MPIKKEMHKNIRTFLLIFIFIFAVFSILCPVDADENTTTVEVDIRGFGDGELTPDVSIEVPDHLDLGNVTKDDPVSKEVYVSINNTGKVNITVTPMLKDLNEVIFSNLYFRTRKSSSDKDLNIFYQIGDYSLNIKKPATGSKTKEYCYVNLNLTDFDGTIKEDLIGYKSEIVFLAMPQ